MYVFSAAEKKDKKEEETMDTKWFKREESTKKWTVKIETR